MKPIRLHSYVDLITNSSSTIYVYDPDTNLIKNIINAILKVGGSTKTCDDLFNIIVSIDGIDDIVSSNLSELDSDNSILTNLKDILSKRWPEFKDMENEEFKILINNTVADGDTLLKSEILCYFNDRSVFEELKYEISNEIHADMYVTLQPKVDVDLAREEQSALYNLERIFQYEEVCDG